MSLQLENEAVPENYRIKYDYTQYSHDNHVNIIPESAFQNLVHDAFKVIADNLRNTYGPYGSTILISAQNQMTSTKDGYNIFSAIGFNHQYKKMVYITIKDIIERVNRTVGDGTTSCILLAEKVFNQLRPLMTDTEDKRHLKEVLDNIELELQSSLAIKRDLEDGSILPMTKESLANIIRVASNYDDKLVDMLMDALMPEYDENGVVVSTNNIIVDSESSFESTSNANYEVDHLPGDYRVRVRFLNPEYALSLDKETSVRILLYDHAFGNAEWKNFYDHYDKSKEETVLILCRNVRADFMDTEYKRYLVNMSLTKRDSTIFLAEVKGDHIQDTLHDLAAVLNTTLRDVHHIVVDCDEIPQYVVKVHNYNCLCIMNAEVPHDYIRDLKIERDTEKSYVRKTLINDRIRDLSLKQKETLVRAKAGTQLELKMITDKIDDCVSIVKSALEFGIVPNMIWYGYDRISRYNYDTMQKPKSELTELTSQVCTAIEHSIRELCYDIWKSKHSNNAVDTFQELCKEFYDNNKPEKSFDIITDSLVEMKNLPTSSQYDLEVLVATLSIVKYLLTSRALIFDSNLLQPQGDQGRFILDDMN